MTIEDLMNAHRKEIPNYDGAPCAPVGKYPERDNGNMRTWEEIDREREERFRRWLGPDLHGWLSDLEEDNK